MSDPQKTLEVSFVSKEGERREAVQIRNLVIGGWTSRDEEAMREHIRELEKIGVAAPPKTPMFYRAGVSRLTADSDIQAAGDGSGGEVEFALLSLESGLWVGAASDHTDRKAESLGITIAKQMCDKPVAPTFWPWSEVAPHWDELELEAHVVEGGERKLYQRGTVAAMLHPNDLINLYCGPGGPLAEGTLILGGTLPAIGGVRATERFEFELRDPRLGRSISHGYTMHPLPILG